MEISDWRDGEEKEPPGGDLESRDDRRIGATPRGFENSHQMGSWLAIFADYQDSCIK